MITYDYLQKLQKVLEEVQATTNKILKGNHHKDDVNILLPKQLTELETLSQEGLGNAKVVKKVKAQKTIFHGVIVDSDSDQQHSEFYDTEIAAWTGILAWLINNADKHDIQPLHQWDVKKGAHFLLNEPFPGWKLSITAQTLHE